MRAYTPGDRAACLRIFAGNVPEFFTRVERPDFTAFLDALPGPYFVGEDGGQVVACGGYALEADGVTATLCWGPVMIDPVMRYAARPGAPK